MHILDKPANVVFNRWRACIPKVYLGFTLSIGKSASCFVVLVVRPKWSINHNGILPLLEVHVSTGLFTWRVRSLFRKRLRFLNFVICDVAKF